jgi:hypothetical protein
MCKAIAVLALVALATAAPVMTPGLEPVKLWADFGSASFLPGEKAGGDRPCPPPRGDLFCGLSDKDAAFVAKTYSVVSLEKCFGVRPGNTHDANHTMANFAATAQQIMRLAPVDKKPPQVLFYWSSNVAVADCYEDAFGGAILQHEEWWLRNKTGGYIWNSVHDVGKRPWIDFTVPAAAAWWVSVPLAAQKLSQGAMAGVFVDSAGNWANVLSKRKLITAEKAAALNAAHRSAISELRRQLRRAIGPEALVLGNALGPCTNPPCGPDGVELLRNHTVDGVCAEHFGAFEWSKNQTTGQVDAAVVRQWLDLFDAAAATNGSVFVKTWFGPETSPIDTSGPSWPAEFVSPFTHKPLNRTSHGIAEAAGDRYTHTVRSYCTLILYTHTVHSYCTLILYARADAGLLPGVLPVYLATGKVPALVRLVVRRVSRLPARSGRASGLVPAALQRCRQGHFGREIHGTEQW